ncbi:MAG: helix-turn-helix domain-containing protein [Bryobacteraceae bacterium]|jgi:predicted DNA-binding transcriptional regulator AlpA|nr:helix-turn-helix domain-containing protein [Bryobacteraceae bacterium]
MRTGIRSDDLSTRHTALAGRWDSQPPEIKRPDVFERLTHCDRLLTAKELGEILSISPKTLYSYVTRAMIPHFKIESCVRFRGPEIAEWLRRRAA